MPASSSANWITKLIVKYLVTPGVLKDLVGKACGGTGSSGGQAVLDKVFRLYLFHFGVKNHLLNMTTNHLGAVPFSVISYPTGSRIGMMRSPK